MEDSDNASVAESVASSRFPKSTTSVQGSGKPLQGHPELTLTVSDPLLLLPEEQRGRLGLQSYQVLSTHSAPVGHLQSPSSGVFKTPLPPPPGPTPVVGPIQFPSDPVEKASDASEGAVISKAWELINVYCKDFAHAAAPKSNMIDTIGRPVSQPSSFKPVSTQTAKALSLCNEQQSQPESLYVGGFSSLESYMTSLRRYNPTESLLDLYRVKKSGSSEIDAMKPKDISVKMSSFKTFQRRAALTSDMANFLSFITSAMNSILALGSLSDEQAGHMKSLLQAQCILSRDLSAVSVCAEVDLHHFRREACLASSNLDKTVQANLMKLPVDCRFMFGGTETAKIIAEQTVSPSGIVASLISAGARFHPYAQKSAKPQANRQRPSATVTSATFRGPSGSQGQSHSQRRQPEKKLPNKSSQPFRGKGRGSRR